MAIKRITLFALALALIASMTIGSLATFAEEDTEIVEEVQVETEDLNAMDGAEIGTALNEGSSSFVGIDAVAAAVLGVSEESLADVGHGGALYQMLEEAERLDVFKAAVTAAKQAQYGYKTETGQPSGGTDMDAVLAGYITTIKEWDGTTELVVTSFGTHSSGIK